MLGLAVGVGCVAAALAGAVGGKEKDARVEQPSLDGAQLVADPEGAERFPGPGDRLAELSLGGPRWDDFRAYGVSTGFDGDLYLLTGSVECDDTTRCHGFMARIADDMAVGGSYDYVDAYPGQLAIAPDGRVAQIGASADLYVLNDRRGPPVHEPESLDELPFQPYSGAYTADGTLVVSSIGEPWIVAIRPDRTVENLLTPASSPEAAPARLDSATARLSLVALPDGRIAFAVNAPDDPDLDGRVFLLAGDSLRPLELPDADPIRRIFPGPDGTLLALDGSHISQIDPATSAVERLIDLSDVADELAPASDAWPPQQAISATAYGDDLYFTADYFLWRVPDAFG